MKYFVGVLIFSTVALSSFAAPSPKPQIVELQVTEKGFVPSTFDVKPGTSVILKVTRRTDATCATSVQVPAKNLKKDLPLNQTVKIDIGKLDKGEIRFACGMNMLEGKIFVR